MSATLPDGTPLLTHRGHAIEIDADGQTWIYSDTLTAVAKDPDRACGRCNAPNRDDGHDACLGVLPGVANACCGHGCQADAYVQFADGLRLGGDDAIAAALLKART